MVFSIDAAASAEPSPPPAPAPADARPATEDRSAVDVAQRDSILPKDWRRSQDRAWTTSGDPTGFHLLIADAKSGYAWRTVASLAEPGFETDLWIGNVCFTGSGRRAVVVYGPRRFTNREETFQRGGFVAVVDLDDGKVTKLGSTASLAYHNPGCGVGETAVLAQNGGAKLGRTRLSVVDTVKATTVRSHELAGQITSAVPVGDKILAAGGPGVIEIDTAGRTKTLTSTAGVPLYLRPDADGGLAFLEAPDEKTAVAKHLPAKARTAKEIARGPLTGLGLSAGAGGKVFLTGKPTSKKSLPRTMSQVDAAPGAEVSSLGQVEIRRDATRGEGAATAAPDAAQPVAFTARMTGSGKTADFRFTPAAPPVAASPEAQSEAQPSVTAQTLAAGSPTNPVDDDRTCAVPRNDPKTQVFQPHWKQVEWAANLAVQDALRTERPANWNQSGLPAWSPQGLRPSIPLEGGGRVPAQILLGVLAQESNLWQASNHALEGMTGNPLVGDFYGRRAGMRAPSTDEWSVNWDEADCGYGVAQVTDGMRVGQQPETTQRAIAVDYATNIAAGLRILQEKWNQTYRAGIRINNADPAKIENWFAALWAYNSGINPQAHTGNTSGCTPGPICTDSRGNWGLGWTNNPANADYPKTRAPFLESPSAAKTPQLWPYPEKVIGWAAYPITKYDFRKSGNAAWATGYNQAWWNDTTWRANAKPPVRAFCDNGPDGNRCDFTRSEPCLEGDYHCWWHKQVTWKTDCADSCGNENMRFPTDYPEPVFALKPEEEAARKMPVEHYRPNCDPYDTDEGGVNDVPDDALIIDNTVDSVNSVRPACLRNWVNQGTFGLTFAQDNTGHYRSKIDLHQIGGGLGGHFWFGHTRKAEAEGGQMAVTGTWRLNQPLNSWARVMVHLPAHSADTQQAAYKIDLGDGTPARERIIPQRVLEHRWVSLGVFRINGTPKVSLANVTRDGDGNEKIAWDAIAFQPLAAKPRNMVVSLGDSFASGEGASISAQNDYYRETDNTGGDIVGSYNDSGYQWRYGNACHRSKYAWSRLARLADSATPIGARADAWDPEVDHKLLACSGARTKELLPSKAVRPDERITDADGKGAAERFHEVSQLDAGFLDENTTLVTLSIGGNDAGFTSVLQSCVVSVGDGNCQDEPLDAAKDPRPLRETGPEVVRNKVIPSVDTVLRTIHNRAPNAKIVLMTYPRLISRQGICVGTTIIVDGRAVPIGINPSEADWVNESTEYLDNQLSSKVSALALELNAPITIADPRQDLEGKAVCGDPAGLHGFTMTRTEGETPMLPEPFDRIRPSQQTFHPNREGTPLFANALNRTLAAMGL
ncbi:hypothetical protein ADK52_14350 [Streptomyces sp. WM6372]|nr:hypothetical protein ADK52_14350 [Streptomyces sp. WM6372]